MDKPKAAAEILARALPRVAFEGWNQRTLATAAQDAGYKRTDAIRVFPDGPIGAAEALLRHYNDAMVNTLAGYHMENMKIRERITTAIHVKLEIMAPDREAMRKIIAFMALPFNLPAALRHLYETVDAIWYAIGDQSTDFNFYTKRLTLAGVYSATLLYWLDDKSPGYTATLEFLDRRIANVMAIEKFKHFVRTKVA